MFGTARRARKRIASLAHYRGVEPHEMVQRHRAARAVRQVVDRWTADRSTRARPRSWAAGTPAPPASPPQLIPALASIFAPSVEHNRQVANDQLQPPSARTNRISADDCSTSSPSTACASASSPVQAVTYRGRVTVSSGSTSATFGKSCRGPSAPSCPFRDHRARLSA